MRPVRAIIDADTNCARRPIIGIELIRKGGIAWTLLPSRSCTIHRAHARRTSEIDGTAYVLDHARAARSCCTCETATTTRRSPSRSRRRPPTTMGVFHILSTWCCAVKFRQELFVDLLKSSMQTFLNAMTFPDKTMYPVASTNDQGLAEPRRVPRRGAAPGHLPKRHLRTEAGTHEPGGDTEAEAGDSVAGGPWRHGSRRRVCAPLNGVVCNEMKGALSDPPGAVRRAAAALFLDTAYRFESGARRAPSLTSPTSSSWRSTAANTAWTTASRCTAISTDGMLAFLDERLSPSLTSRRPRRASAPRRLGPHELRERRRTRWA
ncbi:MAG: hypothetical protein ACLT98_16105 [Eggerthellaceae bacterium]